MNSQARLLKLTLFVAFCLFSSNVGVAEQIVVDENCESGCIAGDFVCSPCYSPLMSDSAAIDIASKTLTTGELYNYFKSRGITKLNRMSLQVDVDCDPDSDNRESVSLMELSFKIQDSANNLVTHAGFGGDELLLDKSEITSFKPEAVLEFDLGYDFMQRFSSDSTESIVLDFSSPSTTSEFQPRVMVSHNMSSFSSGNMTRIIAFITFWGIVFLGVYLMTRPSQSRRPNRPVKPSSSTPAGRAAA